MLKINKIKVFQTQEILNKLDSCIKKKLPFGLVRFGDGTIKAIDSFLNDDPQLVKISEQEGIPINSFEKIIEFWKTSANICDFIDSPEVYFSNKFWERTKKKKKRISEKTIERLLQWKVTYEIVGITNDNFCNPEINFLSCISHDDKKRKTLPDILKDKKVCCITAREDTNQKIQNYNFDILRIPGKNENHYRSFSHIINQINENATKYDLWLIAAGELGRIYPGLIKFKGGRAFDIGSIIDYWCTQEIPSRLIPYMKQTENPLKLELTDDGKEYLKYL